MWWLIPLAVTLGAVGTAYRWCDGQPKRSEWGTLLVGFLNIVLFVAAGFVSLFAWLVYFIVN